MDESINVYNGQECTLNFITIYEYKEYILVFSVVKHQGDDLDVNNVYMVCGDGDNIELDKLFSYIKVYKKEEFDIISIANNLKHIDSLIELFSNLSDYDKLCKYIKTRF